MNDPMIMARDRVPAACPRWRCWERHATSPFGSLDNVLPALASGRAGDFRVEDSENLSNTLPNRNRRIRLLPGRGKERARYRTKFTIGTQQVGSSLKT